MKANKFRPGRSGCEALMFVVRGYAPGSPLSIDDKPAPMDTQLVCGSDIHEGAAYLKRWEPNFSVRSIRVIGMAILLSGSPFNE